MIEEIYRNIGLDLNPIEYKIEMSFIKRDQFIAAWQARLEVQMDVIRITGNKKAAGTLPERLENLLQDLKLIKEEYLEIINITPLSDSKLQNYKAVFAAGKLIGVLNA